MGFLNKMFPGKPLSYFAKQESENDEARLV